MKPIKYLLLVLLSFTMCKTDKSLTVDLRANAPLIIYKTKADYSKNVPVVLNESKDRIVSYPSPGDVYFNGQLALPVKLTKGYWADNMGLAPNSAFTSYTYEEYSQLPIAPTIEELMKRIVDSDPFVEMYNCGDSQGVLKVDEMNRLIKSRFEGCLRLK